MEPEEFEGLPLINAAIALHEMFITLQAAGFTEAQALYIVAQTFRPKERS